MTVKENFVNTINAALTEGRLALEKQRNAQIGLERGMERLTMLLERFRSGDFAEALYLEKIADAPRKS